MRSALLLGCGLGLAAACIDRAPFECDDDEQCEGPGIEGYCVTPGYCAHLDVGCASGLRFGRFAAPALAGQCTEPALATGSSGSSAGEGSSTGDGSGTTDSSGSTSDGSSSSGEPVPVEVCEGRRSVPPEGRRSAPPRPEPTGTVSRATTQ